MAEPMTTVTDLILGILSFYLGQRLLRRSGSYSLNPEKNTAIGMWGLAFQALAFAAFSGAVMHGFVSAHSPGLKVAFWQNTMFLIGTSNALFLTGLIIATRPKKGILILLNFLTLIGYWAWIVFAYSFNAVILHFLLMFIGICVLCILLTPDENGKDPAAYLGLGFSMSLIGVIVQVFGVSPAPWFNHNDLCHVIQIAAMYPLYRGGLLLKVRPPPITQL